MNAAAGGAHLAIRAVMKDVQEAIVKVLDEVTLADLFKRARELQDEALNSPDYAI
jgi:DNA-binding IscR family transcriptional regulator